VAIPIITYAYVGIEIVAATAFEAKSSRSLKFTAKYIALITTITYLVVAISFYLNVSWTNPLLATLSNIFITHARPSLVLPTSTKRTNVIPVIGLLDTHIPKLAGLVNGCLIMIVLSAANTDLYVASRTLSGLVKEIHPRLLFWGWVSRLGAISRNSKIPAVAVLVSAIAFFWLPFLHYTGSYNDEKVCHSLPLKDSSHTR
jgi:amino acid transporter